MIKERCLSRPNTLVLKGRYDSDSWLDPSCCFKLGDIVSLQGTPECASWRQMYPSQLPPTVVKCTDLYPSLSVASRFAPPSTSTHAMASLPSRSRVLDLVVFPFIGDPFPSAASPCIACGLESYRTTVSPLVLSMLLPLQNVSCNVRRGISTPPTRHSTFV